MLELSTDFPLSEKIPMNNDLKSFGERKGGTVGRLVSAVGNIQKVFLIISYHSLTWRTSLRSHSTLNFTSSATICYKAYILSISNYDIISKGALQLCSGYHFRMCYGRILSSPIKPKEQRGTCSNHLKFFFFISP